jgi:AGCS family alanine or glycine:cation symporter
MDIINTVNGWAWGPLMLALLLGTGLYLTLGLRFLPVRKLPAGIRLLLRGGRGDGDGDISPFGALMTSLSATVGTGNIAGVATAIALGGPGALFWMWITALLGMGIKYAEALCAVKFRETDEQGHFSGGPMYYIKNGLHKRWHWLGVAFAVFGSLAGFGIANTVQSHSVSEVLLESCWVATFSNRACADGAGWGGYTRWHSSHCCGRELACAVYGCCLRADGDLCYCTEHI